MYILCLHSESYLPYYKRGEIAQWQWYEFQACMGFQVHRSSERTHTLPRLLKEHEVRGSSLLNSVWLQYWESFFWKSADKPESVQRAPAKMMKV